MPGMSHLQLVLLATSLEMVYEMATSRPIPI